MSNYSKPETKTGMELLTKLNAKPLDEMDDRRLRAENLKGSFVSRYAPSFHHFYDAAELDHGNNDLRAKTSVFKTVDQIIDESEPYVPDEEDLKDALCLKVAETLASLTPNERKPPNGPRSCENYAQRYRSKLPDRKTCVTVLVRGRGLVPYDGEIREQLRNQR
ncbi:MAG: hypothetical protein QY323_04615 [Patescibacteria group bacterium]|nr:MAG: hypothetical protein QY323_04615 [Patescibacteria group bacterium]